MPRATITGVAKPGGIGGGRGPDPQWYLTLSLLAWRDGAGRIRRDSLRLQMPVDHDALQDWMQRLPAGVPLRIEVAPPEPGQPPRRMTGFVAEADDPELARVAEELCNLPPIADPEFGQFTYDARLNWYAARCRWGSCDVELTIPAEAGGGIREGLAVARALFAEHERRTREVRSRVIAELLPLKNDVWLEEGEAPLTADQFWDRLTLESVWVDDAGLFTFWFDDGDIFWRHAIEAGGSLEDGITEATLAG